MKEHGLTHDEAEIFAHFGIFEIRDREAKRLGKSITELDESLKKRLVEPVCDYEMVDGRYLADRYVEEKSLHPDIHQHLSKCSWCNSSFVVALHQKTGQEFDEIHRVLNLRTSNDIDAEELGITVEELIERRKKNRTLRWGHGEDCYTMKERVTYARTGSLTNERLAHTESCIGCKRMILADREDVIQTGKIGGLAYRH